MYRMKRETDVAEWFARREIPTDLEELDGELEHLPQKCETLQSVGDAFEHTWSGGGGFGDPLDRDPERVAEDVRNDAVSAEAARSLYGVALEPDGTVDLDGTGSARELIRKERLS
jgi:N-methylhydantoinase B